METQSHNPVWQIKGLFHSISMMNIDINVNHSGINKQQLKYGKYNIIDITKPTRLWFFCMMQTPTKINRHICLSIQQQWSSINGRPRWYLTIIIQSIEGRTICWLSNFELLFFLQKFQTPFLILWESKLINPKAVKLVGNVLTHILL